MKTWDLVFDIEANNLLNNETIDYTSVPYKLKDGFKMHCICVDILVNGKNYLYAFYDGDTVVLDGREHHVCIEGEEYSLTDYVPTAYIHKPLKEFKNFVSSIPQGSTVVGHNIINFDLLAVKLHFGVNYKVEEDMNITAPLGCDRWGETPVMFEDTLILAKTLNPDRLGGQSLEALSEKCGVKKIQFRKHISEYKRFLHFAPDMLYYCIYDVKSNRAVRDLLHREMTLYNWGDKWNQAIKLEKAVAELITRQEHRGFWFNKELAAENLKDLDTKMEERRLKIEAFLPKKPATKAYLQDFIPPATQFLKSGEPSSHIMRFINKHGGTIQRVEEAWVASILGKEFKLPIPKEPIIEPFVAANVGDTTHIKNWLVGLGWKPLEYKEKDITVDVKKNKLSSEKLATAITKYIEQTVATNFRQDRCDHLLGYNVITGRTSESVVRNKLNSFFDKRIRNGRSIKVLTNPSFTVGQEKEICRNLIEFASSNVEYAGILDIVEYLTYRHRRNSILGGGMDYEDFDDELDNQTAKGYLANVRDDGRIPTPADTCGAATSRFKHRLVANIPRVTSLYGENMRAMFGVDKDCYQIGYDFDSLEAREEANFCWKYEDEPREYCTSLLMDKPNDVHTKMSEKISAIIGRAFARGPAKSVKYGCLPVDNSEVLTKDGWKYYSDLYIGQQVLTYNPESCVYEWKPITYLWFYENAEIIKMENKWVSFESTSDHRWYGYKRLMKGSGKNAVRYKANGFYRTDEVNSEVCIQHAAKYWNELSTITPDQAGLIAWLLSDGYYVWSELEEITSCSKGKRKGIVASIAQSEHKYWRELERILHNNRMEYTKDTIVNNANGRLIYIYRLKSKCIRDFMDFVVGSRKQKHNVNWVEWVLKLDQPALQSFFYNFCLADGHTSSGGNKIITQNIGNIADAVCLVGNLIGKRFTFNNKTDKCLSIAFNDNCFTTGQRLVKTFTRNTDVFCLTTANSTFVMRQNGLISITGNCTYGAQASKVAKTIGSDLNTGELIFNAFWEAAAPLKLLKDSLNREWERFDKKRIIGIDGRLVPTRSAHAILNSKFQNGGVICAKRAMVLHDRKLQAEGLIVDFFKDSLQDRQWCQQLVAYHDEAQSEVSKKSVKFKMFETEAEAIAFKQQELAQGKIWSDIKPSPKGGYFVAYCRAGELAVESVSQAGIDYGMNVSLTAGYIVGLNWKMCH